MAIRYPYAVFLSLFLCLLFLTRFFNYNPWQHPHAWTPQLLHVEKALVVVTKSQETSLWVEDVDPSWRKYTYLITQDTLNSDSNITLSVPVVCTPFPTVSSRSKPLRHARRVTKGRSSRYRLPGHVLGHNSPSLKKTY